MLCHVETLILSILDQNLLIISQFSCIHSVLSNSLQPHRLQHTRLPCLSPTPRACSNSCPLSRWCHPTISSSVVPFSFCLESFPASGSFPVSQFFPSGGQSIGASASASVLPMNIPEWFPLGWTGLISLQSKGPSRVFSNTTVQEHQFDSLCYLLMGFIQYRIFIMVNPVMSSGHSGLSYNFLENWAHEDILNYTGYSNPRPIYILKCTELLHGCS